MAGLGKTIPSAGGRVHAVRAAPSAEGSAYALTLSTRDEQWQAQATISADGEVQLQAPEPAPPGWLLDLALSVVRTACRGRTPDAWPQRLTRWRAAPRPE